MRSVTILFAIAMVLSVVACSDGNSAPPAKHAYEVDSSVYVPPVPPAPGPVTFVVKGHGTVSASDLSFTCASDGVTDTTCTAPHVGVTLYAEAALGWGFDHWDPSMSTDNSMYLESWTYSPETVVFTRLPPIPGADY